jgi:hypothetical protein
MKTAAKITDVTLHFGIKTFWRGKLRVWRRRAAARHEKGRPSEAPDFHHAMRAALVRALSASSMG